MNNIPQEIRDRFPKIGDTLIFKEVPKFYYPMYLDMGEKARKELIPGKKYIVSKVEIYSSWCAVWIDDLNEHDDCYNLSFFKWMGKTSNKGINHTIY